MRGAVRLSSLIERVRDTLPVDEGVALGISLLDAWKPSQGVRLPTGLGPSGVLLQRGGGIAAVSIGNQTRFLAIAPAFARELHGQDDAWRLAQVKGGAQWVFTVASLVYASLTARGPLSQLTEFELGRALATGRLDAPLRPFRPDVPSELSLLVRRCLGCSRTRRVPCDQRPGPRGQPSGGACASSRPLFRRRSSRACRGRTSKVAPCGSGSPARSPGTYSTPPRTPAAGTAAGATRRSSSSTRPSKRGSRPPLGIASSSIAVSNARSRLSGSRRRVGLSPGKSEPLPASGERLVGAAPNVPPMNRRTMVAIRVLANSTTRSRCDGGLTRRGAR